MNISQQHSGAELGFIAYGNFDIYAFEGDVKVGGLVNITTQLSKHIQMHPDKNLVFDLARVTYMDSSTVRLFINLKKKMEANQKQLYLLQPSEQVLKILKETNLDKIFTAVGSVEEVEQIVSLAFYQNILPYTVPENKLHRLKCSCAVCGSKEVVGYLIDQSACIWKWEEDDPYPSSYWKDGNERVDLFSLFPVVCMDCFMSSLRINDFHLMENDKIAVRSILHENSKYILSKSIKKRKKIMESAPVKNDSFFAFPRKAEANLQAYLLAEMCAHSMAMYREDANPFMIGYLNYLTIQYAEKEKKSEYLDKCRAWMSQVLNEKNSYNHLELAQAYFVLLQVDLNLEKFKEASVVYDQFTALMESLTAPIAVTDIYSPHFWYQQSLKIWQKEINNKSSAMRA
ncbi:MAG: STAS domain-containing protein [Chitinivibrionales bacterium]|nr:STAS domain-containing protein [Chitinivibrionales bacterium]